MFSWWFSEKLAGRRQRGIRKAIGGFESGGVSFQESIGVGQFEDAIDHAGSGGEAKRPPGSLEARKTIDEFSEAAAIELGDFRKVHNDMLVIVAKHLIEGEFQLLAFDAHLERAAQLENDDAGLQLFFVD
jgi:hypothetical protein